MPGTRTKVGKIAMASSATELVMVESQDMIQECTDALPLWEVLWERNISQWVRFDLIWTHEDFCKDLNVN